MEDWDIVDSIGTAGVVSILAASRFGASDIVASKFIG